MHAKQVPVWHMNTQARGATTTRLHDERGSRRLGARANLEEEGRAAF